MKLELNKIFKNLNIKFDNSCLNETLDGSFTPGITGFDGKQIKNTRKQKDLYNFTSYLSNKDILKFQRIFEKNYHKWNYKFLEKIQEVIINPIQFLILLVTLKKSITFKLTIKKF